MKITDYIHFYVGAKILYKGVVSTITGLQNSVDGMPGPVMFFNNEGTKGLANLKDCKLLLIPISKLTAEDFRQLDGRKQLAPLEDFIVTYSAYLPYFSPNDTMFLISKGYDVFNLIKEGYAIDITTAEYGKV